jgi:hypothetical protein
MGFADIKSITTKITSANTPTQIFTSPWRAQRRYFVKKMILTNEGTASVVKFYDDDLANATPPIRGDAANSPLLEFNVGANSTLSLSDLQLPFEFFISGMVGSSSIANMVVTVEIQED